VECGLPYEAERDLSGNVKRGAGVERRYGFQQGESSEGKNPRSASGMKQGRDGSGGSKALRG
jgi:hypothetical protein